MGNPDLSTMSTLENYSQGRPHMCAHQRATHPHTGQIILESTPLPRRQRSQKLWKQVRMQGSSYGSLHRGHCKGFHFLESTSSGFSIGWKISPDIVAFANTLLSPVSMPPADQPGKTAMFWASVLHCGI